MSYEAIVAVLASAQAAMLVMHALRQGLSIIR